MKIKKGKRGRKRKERRGLSQYHSTLNTSAWYYASSTLLDVAPYIVGPGCLQGCLGCRILPEAEKPQNIKQANPWVASDTEP